MDEQKLEEMKSRLLLLANKNEVAEIVEFAKSKAISSIHPPYEVMLYFLESAYDSLSSGSKVEDIIKRLNDEAVILDVATNFVMATKMNFSFNMVLSHAYLLKDCLSNYKKG